MDIEGNYLIHLQAAREALQKENARVYIPQPLGLLQNQQGMHFHSYPELFLQISGRRSFICPLETFEIHSGEICLMPSLLPHREHAFNEQGSPFDGIVLCADKDVLNIHRSIVRESGNRPNVGPNLLLRTADAAAIGQLLVNAVTITDADIRNPLLYSLLGLVCNNLRDHSRNRPATQLEPSEAIVESARAIIHAYLPDSNLTISRIAAEVGCSTDHLSRCFQRHLGLPAQHYLQSERLSLACRLLKKPNLRICEVAWACGFSSANYFIRSFRKQTGKTPKHYRRD